MAIENIKNIIKESVVLSEQIAKIYNIPAEDAYARMISQAERHVQRTGKENIMLFSSPGRIEVIGNHTDHNNGKVVAAAVTVDTLAVVTPRDDGKIAVVSEGYPDVTVDISDITPKESEYGTSDALVCGVVAGFLERGYKVGGFDATLSSSVFKGAGMSSSASYEVLVAEILNDLYNGGKIDAVTKAIVSQYAENVFFGKPSGLMDQSAIALGGVSYIDFKDTKAPIVKKMDWSFEDVSVVVINCGGDHCDLTPQYAAIKTEMEAVAKEFGKDKLRFVDKDEFYGAIPTLMKKLSGRAILRAMHYFEENERVETMKTALEAKDEAKVFDVITGSGKSSLTKLQNCYPEGSPAEPIPLALELASSFKGVCAYRVHGGGFAGTILTLVKRESVSDFVKYARAVYGDENVFIVNIRPSGAIRIL